MIPIKRLNEDEPTVLQQVFRDGKSELDRAKQQFAAFKAELEAMGNLSSKKKRFAFDYKRYREREVRQALEAMFNGKCAYCEQRYGALQPMDVEHWRPKARAEYGSGIPANETGYWWLASSWENLLPSCIDCNRGRKHQIDIESGERVMMGKASQFPLEPGTQPVTEHTVPIAAERPLLLDPCDDGFDPAEHFAYDDGIMVGLTARAKASIRVYALNRPELVHERQATVRVFEHRLRVLTDIAELVAAARKKNEPLDTNRTLVEQMHDRVRVELFAMAEAERPFSGMIAFMLRQVARELARSDE